MSAWWVALAAALAIALAVPPRAPWPSWEAEVPASPAGGDDRDDGWLRRGRPLWSLLAAIGAAIFVSGPWGQVAGGAAAVGVWIWASRAETPGARRRRERARRELPALVQLLVSALESGGDVPEALRLACEALPGPTSADLGRVPTRLALGVSADVAWRPLLGDPELAPLARTMVRAHRSGAPVTHEVARLADELERRSQLQVEERARAVGVQAAIPLGVCLLPSFLLIGIVPLVVGLLRSLAL